MARYDGVSGSTQRRRVHYTCPDGAVLVVEVYSSIDADADPELAQRLMADETQNPASALNLVQCPSEDLPRVVASAVVYHAPASEILVLVLPETLRHRELFERAALLRCIAEDTTAAVPAYVRDFQVAYGGVGLRGLLEREAEQTRSAKQSVQLAAQVSAQGAELDDRERVLGEQQAELERLAAQLDRSQRDLDEVSSSLTDRETAMDRRSQELEHRATELAELAQSAEQAAARRVTESDDIEAAPVPVAAAESRPVEATVPYASVDPVELQAGSDLGAIPVVTYDEHTDAIDAELAAMPLEEGEVIVADQVVGAGASMAAATGVVAQDGETRIGGATDVAIERWIVSRDKYLKLVDDSGAVRLAVRADTEELECLMGERLGLRLQLHQLPSYPLVTMTFGTVEAVRGAGDGPLLVFFFDVRAEDDRAVLSALAKEFLFRFELFDSEHLPVRQRAVAGELAENVRYILAAADARLAELPVTEHSFDRAILGYDNPAYDRLGANHAERREFSQHKLSKLARESEVRRAMAIVRRFTLPECEEYLVAIRGYPLPEWRAERRKVIERAIEVGLWVGPSLAKVAISESIAASRAELLRTLTQNFTTTIAGGRHDLDDDTIDDNWNELEAAGKKYGVAARAGNAGHGRTSSSQAPVASGTIGYTEPRRRTSVTGVTPAVQGSVEQLVTQLEDHHRRLEAAIELARRGEERAVGPVFNALRRMTRGESVRLLGFAVGFGDGATPHLIDGLRSRKSYLRQGCALALALIGSDRAVEAVCDQLVAEPTEIWEEIARSFGQVGAGAIVSLTARLSGHGERGQERVAMALAHVAAQGQEPAVEALIAGTDLAVAAVAKRALTLTDDARAQTSQLLGAQEPVDETVNRAFSRSFFEAAESIMPGAAPALARDAAELTGPAMLLDESDLIEAGEFEDAELLDERDLIPT